MLSEKEKEKIKVLVKRIEDEKENCPITLQQFIAWTVGALAPAGKVKATLKYVIYKEYK